MKRNAALTGSHLIFAAKADGSSGDPKHEQRSVSSARSVILRFAAAVALVASLLGLPTAVAQRTVTASSEVSRPPVSGFIENVGQWDTEARFVARFDSMIVRAEAGALFLQHVGVAEDGQRSGSVVRFEFTCAGGRDPQPVGGSLPGVFHFLIGNDRDRWRTHVSHFATLSYPGGSGQTAWLVEVGAGSLTVRPPVGATSGAWQIRIEGTVSVLVSEDATTVSAQTLAGALLIGTGSDSDLTPRGLRIASETPGRWTLAAPEERQSTTGSESLHLVWATYLGGLSTDNIKALDHDYLGRPVVGGQTYSMDFPTTPGAFDPDWNGSSTSSSPTDAFVTCLAADGSHLVFSTFLGGAEGYDDLKALSVLPSGSVLAGGNTSSDDFPISPGAYQHTNQSSDAFITRLSADGSMIEASTYLGAPLKSDSLEGLAVLPDGRIAVCGETSGPDFPVTPNAIKSFYHGIGKDAFLAVMDADLTAVLYGTYLGGGETDIARGLAVGPDRRLAVVGGAGPGFQVTPGAFDTTPGNKGFALVLDTASYELIWSSYIPGGLPRKVRMHRDGSLFIAGTAIASTTFPVTPGAFQTEKKGTSGSTDAFILRMLADGTRVHAATYFGGTVNEMLGGLELDSAGRPTIVGHTHSGSVPTTPGAWQTNKSSPESDVYIARLDTTLSTLLYGSYYGGPGGELGGIGATALALDDGLGATVATFSSHSYPTTPGTFDPTGGEKEGFKGVVAKLTLLPTGVTRYGAPSAPPTELVPPRPAIGVTSMPKTGTGFGVTCVSVPEGAGTALLAVSFAQLATALPVKSAGLWVDPSALLALLSVQPNVDGYAVASFHLPADPALVGVQSFWQFLGPLPGSDRWWASDALAVTFRP